MMAISVCVCLAVSGWVSIVSRQQEHMRGIGEIRGIRWIDMIIVITIMHIMVIMDTTIIIIMDITTIIIMVIIVMRIRTTQIPILPFPQNHAPPTATTPTPPSAAYAHRTTS